MEFCSRYFDSIDIVVFTFLPIVALGFVICSIVKAVRSKRYTTFWYRLFLFFSVLLCSAGWLLNYGYFRATWSLIGMVHILLFFIASTCAATNAEPEIELGQYTKWAYLTSFPVYLFMPDSATGELYALCWLLQDVAGVPEIIFDLCMLISVFSLVANIIFIALQIKEMRYY